jgi:ABC-type polysaccharide/polyol phosphate export permease
MLREEFRTSLALARVEFKLRNEGSYLGIFWYLLNPLLMFLFLLAVFSTRLGQNIPSYSAYLLLGIIMFNFFQRATVESTRIINKYRLMIKSIKFPLVTLVGSVILQTLFSHIFEIFLFAVFLFIFKVPLSGVVVYPLILILFSLFTTGTSFILSALAVYFVDLDNIWLFITRLLWFVTPIFYAAGTQGKLPLFNLFNPIYYFITIARDIVIYAKLPELWLVSGMLGYIVLFLIVGIVIFNKLKYKFAELI